MLAFMTLRYSEWEEEEYERHDKTNDRDGNSNDKP